MHSSESIFSTVGTFGMGTILFSLGACTMLELDIRIAAGVCFAVSTALGLTALYLDNNRFGLFSSATHSPQNATPSQPEVMHPDQTRPLQQ